MRNLSYREAAIAISLIAAASGASYRLWFMPALTQIERDRHTLEALVATLAKPTKAAATALAAHQVSPAALPVAKALTPRPLPGRKPTPSVNPRPKRDLTPSSRCDARDPLCGDLEL